MFENISILLLKQLVTDKKKLYLLIQWQINQNQEFLKSSYFVFWPNVQKAEAQLAYELQAAKIQQRIRNEEIQIQVCTIHKAYKYTKQLASQLVPDFIFSV